MSTSTTIYAPFLTTERIAVAKVKAINGKAIECWSSTTSMMRNSIVYNLIDIGHLMLIWALFALSFSSPTEAQLDENGFRPPVPTYFIDPNLLKLTLARARNCGVHFVNDNRTIFALEELAYLSTQSASEYFRGHELLAYHYFVENRANNPHYREYINDAEMEYIPILPLAWKTQKSGCSYSSFITMLGKQTHLRQLCDAVDGEKGHLYDILPPFTKQIWTLGPSLIVPD